MIIHRGMTEYCIQSITDLSLKRKIRQWSTLKAKKTNYVEIKKEKIFFTKNKTCYLLGK